MKRRREKVSKQSVEVIKEESNYLLGTLPEQLASDVDHFDDDAKQLLKFHGVYQQEDRDSRKERKKQNLGPAFIMMVRSKLPGGKLTPEQWLAHDELCDKYANGTFRLTSRQSIQFHGIIKRNLRQHIKEMNEALISTLAACGDVERNIMCCPAPVKNNPVYDEIQALTDRLAEHLAPRTPAYHEIWINGEKQIAHYSGEVIEPIYGKHYLPRKFKTAVALPEDNCVDALANDLAIIAKHSNGKIEGYNIYAGGGMGMTHGMEKTYPRLATPVCFATPEQVVDVSVAVIKVQRDYGNREDRRNARLKYTIDRLGQEKFNSLVSEYFGAPLPPVTGEGVFGYDNHLGWHEQGDGKWFVGVHIHSGRVADNERGRIRSGLREIVQKFRLPIRLTAQQNLLFCDIDPSQKQEIESMLDKNGMGTARHLTNLYKDSLACVAMPTCGLALAESERALSDILGIVQSELSQLGLADEDIVFRMTGCPNGCVRPFNSDIGLVGRSPGKYVIFLGGNKLGTELSFQYRDLVPVSEIGSTLRGPLLYFKENRRDGERFGDFCRRIGKEKLLEVSAVPA
ncbi:NADPH-dependent assimilatory sulfite reductase hemoprotein subunit [bacterium]|nr:NADPH-dependent assimilatory sulfite reductase hemoprotein subunit [bacterium]